MLAALNELYSLGIAARCVMFDGATGRLRQIEGYGPQVFLAVRCEIDTPSIRPNNARRGVLMVHLHVHADELSTVFPRPACIARS